MLVTGFRWIAREKLFTTFLNHDRSISDDETQVSHPLFGIHSAHTARLTDYFRLSTPSVIWCALFHPSSIRGTTQLYARETDINRLCFYETYRANKITAHLHRVRASPFSLCAIPFPRGYYVFQTMSTNSPQSGGCDGAHSSLTASIGALTIAEQNSSLKPAKTVFGTAGVLLATIRVRSLNLQRSPSGSRLSRTLRSTNKAT